MNPMISAQCSLVHDRNNNAAPPFLAIPDAVLDCYRHTLSSKVSHIGSSQILSAHRLSQPRAGEYRVLGE